MGYLEFGVVLGINVAIGTYLYLRGDKNRLKFIVKKGKGGKWRYTARSLETSKVKFISPVQGFKAATEAVLEIRNIFGKRSVIIVSDAEIPTKTGEVTEEALSKSHGR